MNEDRRINIPEYYGYIPNERKSKIQCFAALFFISTFNLFVRTMTVVLIYVTGGAMLAVLALVVELAIYMLTKIVRSDFRYWVPIYGVPGYVMALFARLIVKLAADWTACVQFRHPQEVGGFIFSFGMVMLAACGITSAALYDKEECGKSCVWSNEVVLTVMCSSCFCLFVSISALFCCMNQDYLFTFTSFTCGHQWIRSTFKREEHERKFEIFGANVYLWVPYIGDEVKAYLTKELPKILAER